MNSAYISTLLSFSDIPSVLSWLSDGIVFLIIYRVSKKTPTLLSGWFDFVLIPVNRVHDQSSRKWMYRIRHPEIQKLHASTYRLAASQIP